MNRVSSTPFDPEDLIDFLIRVNENFMDRADFLKDPIPIIQTLLAIELSDTKKKEIIALTDKLTAATGGVFNIPTDEATVNLLRQLRNETMRAMGDDSIIL